MHYPLSKLLKEKVNKDLRLTRDGRLLLTELLNNLDKKLSHAGKNNYLDAATNLLGEDVGSKFDKNAKYNAKNGTEYKTASQATKDLLLVFPVHRYKEGGDLPRSIYCASLLEEVAFKILSEASKLSINNKFGKAQIIIAISFSKQDTMESTVKNMSPLSQLAWKLGYIAPQPTAKESVLPKYTDYGMQCILSSKGFQAVKQKMSKTGYIQEKGLDYKKCMTVLLFGKRGKCPKGYQTRNLLNGRCEGKKPCKDYQTRNADGRCKGRKLGPKKSKTRKTRKSVRKCVRGKLKSPTKGGRVCKKKPGRKA